MFQRLNWAKVDPVAISGQYVVAPSSDLMFEVPSHETRGQTSDSALSRRVFNAAFGSESESR
jgi:hypothetical protein